MIIVEPGDPIAPPASALLDASQALMRRLFDPEENHFLSHAALAQPDVRFFTARDGAETLGCAALKLCDGYGEVKSFYVSGAARGRGIGAALLRQIEDTARDEGVSLLRLETADRLDAACRLYERHGFTRRGPFGAYAENGTSVFMEKTLPATEEAETAA
ncbi:acetyltransferase, GNAT family protein [Pseudooceanicola batsensis HTCC2597]|uniref:Acetyltransferase, GNAT family protein n=1 Tax=Pseudooceanicola batsensis (strain ATCC BAA-863 / DSM 15984 / KCTC 12145 / HTCC2597) TaxID=252305 RepID=A3TVI5_PSEBH|nr:GNAT family N-acetyltransferase [Pseudooceanicola batsensis]EAQ04531.1 acetyltransferase, GNAT family protein [Pseudooceanicola batsensis HTCC2597]